MQDIQNLNLLKNHIDTVEYLDHIWILHLLQVQNLYIKHIAHRTHVITVYQEW